MKSLGTSLIMILLFTALASHAQTLSYVKENSIYKKVTTSSDTFFLNFSDGYKEKIVAPYEIKESAAQARCPCKSYDLKFTNKNGERITRTVVFYPGKETIDYFGADGVKYTVSQLLDSAGTPVAGDIPDSNKCDYVGEPNLVTIKNKNSCGDTRICYGRVTGCGGDDTEVSCMATINGQCPDAKSCLDDPDVIFSANKGILPKSTQKQNTNNSSSSAQ
jgi:hypothetical protein